MNLKTALRVGGVASMAVGLMLLRVRNHVFDKGDLSAFEDVAELGAFVQAGSGLIIVGLVVFGLSFVVRGELGD